MKTRLRLRRRKAAVLAFAIVWATSGPLSPAVAHHTVFDYAVGRFEIDGADLGPLDGVPDLVDEFDDGLAYGFGSGWSLYGGTVTEYGGEVHFTNPGTHVVRSGIPFDISNIISNVGVHNDVSTYVVRSFWRAQPPAQDHFIHLTAGNDFEYFSAALQHANGLWLVQSVLRQYTGENSFAAIPIDESEITGPIVLGIRYNGFYDHRARAVFSLDGGVTYREPFYPVPVFVSTDVANFVLGADPSDQSPFYTTSTTSTTTSTTSTTSTFPPGPCGAGGTPVLRTMKISRLLPPTGDEVIRFKATMATYYLTPNEYHPNTEGARILIREQAGANTLVDVTVPTGAIGSGCGVRDGWRISSRYTFPGAVVTYTYTNRTNALPPACIPGSAAGLQSLQYLDAIRRPPVYSYLQLQAVFQNASIAAAPAVPVQTTVVLGQTPELEQAGHCVQLDFGRLVGKGSGANLLP